MYLATARRYNRLSHRKAVAMAAVKPDSSRVMRAIEIYLKLAYGESTPPVTVRSLVSTLRAWGGDFFEGAVFATDFSEPPTGTSLCLGTPFLPPRKLEFKSSPTTR